MKDLSGSGYGYNSDGTNLNIFEEADLMELNEAVYVQFISLLENYNEDQSEPNPFLMGAEKFVKEYFFGTHYKNEAEEYYEEIKEGLENGHFSKK